jgi:hypothetical protein
LQVGPDDAPACAGVCDCLQAAAREERLRAELLKQRDEELEVRLCVLGEGGRGCAQKWR